MVGADTSGKKVVSTEGAGPDAQQFASSNNPQRLLGIAEKTVTVAVRAMPDNSGLIYVGYDDDVNVSNGFPLEAGDSITLEIDASQQGIFALTDTVGDEVRWIALK